MPEVPQLADDDALATLRARPWTAVRAPAEVQRHPAMLSRPERDLLYWIARDHWTGAGELVDAGCFLGGSTAAFAAGLRDRAAPPAPASAWSRWFGAPSRRAVAASPPAVPRLHAYDRFILDQPFLLEGWPQPLEGVALGGDFRPAFDRATAAFAPYFRVAHGDLATLGWTGQPIEALFLDVLKAPETNDAALRHFFPHLIPGRALVVHQDYVQEWLPWIHVTMELLHDHFEFVDWLPHSTAVFVLTDAIPAATLAACRWDGLPPREKLRLMDRALARFHGVARGLIDCAKGVLLAEIAGLDAALAHWRQCGRSHAGLRQATVAAENLTIHYERARRHAA